MDLNRHQFFFIGMLILLIGLQVRTVRAYVLTPQATQVLAEYSGANTEVAEGLFFNPRATAAAISGARKVVEPPEWIGWCLMSIGAVLVLHSLAMPKPGG